MQKQHELYSGKAKSVFSTSDQDLMVLVFRNDTSAFDGKKVEQLDRKGAVNNQFNAWIMEKLEAAGIPTHHEKLLSANNRVMDRNGDIVLSASIKMAVASPLIRRV